MTAPAYSVIPFLLSQVRTDTDALIGGSVYFYSPGTTETTGITIYLDKDGLQPANNPYTLDGDATAQLYASGSYRIVIKDVNGVTQFDRDNLYFSAGPDYVTQLAIGNYASLAEAVTAIGTDSARLLINEPITVTADLVVPANIILERIEPGKITVNPGVTLTITSAPISDASEWFLGTGTVTVTNYPQEQAWWGNTQRIDSSGYYIKSANILSSPYTIQNLSFTASVGSKALTVALKGVDGNAPSASNPINIAFRSATATSSALVNRTVTAATSVVLSSGSTLGFTSAQTAKIYVWAIDYGGTVELALSRRVKWSATELVSTTAEGGAGAADSGATLYSTTARTNVACRLLGNITIQTGATAGEWDNAPTVLAVCPDQVARGSWTQQYADDSGEIQDVALGAKYYALVSNSASSAPTFHHVMTTSELSTVAGTEVYFAKATTVRSTSNTSYTKIKETEPLKRAGECAVSFAAHSNNALSKARVYKNGEPIGSQISLTTDVTTYTANFTLAIGDVIQVYAYAGTAYSEVYVGSLYVTGSDPFCVRDASGL